MSMLFHRNERATVTILRVVTLASSKGRYGGPFDTARRQCKMLESAGCNIKFLAGKEKGDFIDPLTVPTYSTFPTVRKVIPTKDFTGLFSLSILKQIVKDTHDSNVVHISLSRELIPIVSMFLALAMRRRVVLQPHGMLTARTSWAHKVVDMVIKPAVVRAEAIVALTQQEANDLEETYGPIKNRITIIGNPIPENIKVGGPANREKGTVTFIARLHPRKRVADFIESARIAHKAGWHEQYIIVGPDAGELHLVDSAAASLPNLSYEGTLSGNEVTERVARSSLFVLTSKSEPWGNVLVTALASGIPVVVPASAALASLIENYDAGKVYADGDTKALAQAVHTLLGNPEAYERAQKNAVRLVELEMSSATLQRKLVDLYEQKRG